MALVKWIKIVTDIFDDEKILLIESLPGADSIIVIWFKLLCLAGKNNNNGMFMLNNRIAYTDEMLAAIIRKDVREVRIALNTFEQFGMVEMIDNVITIPNWNRHQALDAYEKRKERDKLYQKQKREEKKLLISSQKSADSSADYSSDVGSLEEEKEKEEDIYIYSRVVDYLNGKVGTKFKSTTGKTKTLIKARLNEGFKENDFIQVIDNKVAEWINTDMAKYLRPETLFGTKFEGYLNQKGVNNNGGINRIRSTGPNTSKGENKYEGFRAPEIEYEFTEEEKRRIEEELI